MTNHITEGRIATDRITAATADWASADRVSMEGPKRVRVINIKVSSTVDYDIDYMRGRLVTTTPSGDRVHYRQSRLLERAEEEGALAGPLAEENERRLIDKALGLGFGDQVADLERQISSLRADLAEAKRRWWHRFTRAGGGA